MNEGSRRGLFGVARVFQRVKAETSFPTNITGWKARATLVAAAVLGCRRGGFPTAQIHSEILEPIFLPAFGGWETAAPQRWSFYRRGGSVPALLVGMVLRY